MKAMTVKPMVKGSLRKIEVNKPVPGPKEALVRVIRVGLDGTDKEIGEALYGEAPKGSDYLIVGHESFGIVEETGSEVKEVKKGDYVVATVRRPDNCLNCTSGESDFCIKGDYTERGIKGAHGYMCEYYTESEEYLVKIPEEVRQQAVMLEPLSIVEKAIMQIFKIQDRMVWKPKKAIVFGTGVVGLFGAMLLRQRGIAVTSVDRTEKHEVKDRIYEEFEIWHVNSKNAKDGIAALTGSDADIVLELTGNPAVVEEAMSVCSRNGVCCLLSVTGGSYKTNIDMGKWNYEMVLGNRLVFGSVNSNKTHFVQGVNDMLSIEKAHPGAMARLITNRVKIDDFTSYDVIENGKALKTVIEISEDK